MATEKADLKTKVGTKVWGVDLGGGDNIDDVTLLVLPVGSGCSYSRNDNYMMLLTNGECCCFDCIIKKKKDDSGPITQSKYPLSLGGNLPPS